MTEYRDGTGMPPGSNYFRPLRPGEAELLHQAHPPPRPQRVASIDHRCEGMIPGRLLHVLRLEQDQYALRIEYVITPPLPAGPTVPRTMAKGREVDRLSRRC
jgi:hypothetical protein